MLPPVMARSSFGEGGGAKSAIYNCLVHFYDVSYILGIDVVLKSLYLFII